jgi:hypothetical protein
MRTALRLAVVMASLGGAVAFAQQPVDPYGTADVAGPATEPAQPINPYGAYPAPPSYGYQPPTSGPGYVDGQPPAYQRGYYLYPTQGQPPVYYAPPCCCQPCQTQPTYQYQYQYPVYPTYALRPPVIVRKKPVRDGVRRFSLGVHGTAMWFNQNVGPDQVVLGGAGIQLRIRSKGRFGLELSQGFLGANLLNGNFQRQSFPFTFSLMFYIFPNQDTRHFNIYGLAGFGGMLDFVHLYDENGAWVEQDFLEFIGHVGAGAELRWKWFAIEADARFFGTVRDNSSTPAAYYNGVAGGPIPATNYGVSANAYLSFWF